MGVGATGLNGTNAGDRSEGGEPEKQGDRGEAAGQSTGERFLCLGHGGLCGRRRWASRAAVIGGLRRMADISQVMPGNGVAEHRPGW